jgi:hypothetical protein
MNLKILLVIYFFTLWATLIHSSGYIFWYVLALSFYLRLGRHGGLFPPGC